MHVHGTNAPYYMLFLFVPGMPQLDRWSTLQLGLLLLAVPTQYIISTYVSNNESQRNFALKR